MGPPYYPEQKLHQSDSLRWPLIFDISIDIKDIKDLEIGNNTFISNILVSSFSEYEQSFISMDSDTLSLKHDEFFQIYLESNNSNESYVQAPTYYSNDVGYLYLFYDKFNTKSVRYVSSSFDLNWELHEYPFDTQELKYKFTTTVDTSIIKLRHSKKFPSIFNPDMPNLKEGYALQSITSAHKYNTDESDLILIEPSKVRPIVTQTLELVLNVKRESFWLFFKLFTGGILSFLLSSMVFIIPKEEFEAKITLLVGAIFGAIGNRYFVDSVLPGMQVLTKADIINNLIILFVFINILLTLLIHSKAQVFKFFKDPMNNLFYTIYSFSIILAAILIC